MQPTPGDVHVNKWLTNVSVAYMETDEEFISSQVFPNIPVGNKSDIYPIFDKDVWFRDEMRKRPAGTETEGIGWGSTQGTYNAEEYGLHHDIPDPRRRNSDSVFKTDAIGTRLLTKMAQIRREVQWVSSYFKTGVWTKDRTGVSSGPTGTQFLQWDQSAADPIKDVLTDKIKMQELTGFAPNTLVLSPYVYNSLRFNSLIMDRIKYTQRGVITAELLASLFEVKRVLIPTGIVNAAKEGLAASYGFMFGKHAFLCYSVDSPSIEMPTAGYTFSWTGLYGNSAWGGRVKKYRMEQLASDRIEIEMAYDMRVIAPDLGVFYSGAVA